MTTTPHPPEPDAKPVEPSAAVERSAARDGLPLVAVAIAFGAVFIAVIAVGLGWRAVDESKAGGSGEAETAMVSLSEFSVSPVTIGAGGSLHVMNDGSVAHNLAIDGTDLKTPDLAAGETATIDLSSLEPGTYTMICQISGHQSSGMEATLTITEAGAASTGGEVAADSGTHSGHMTEADYQKLTDNMLASASAFPAATEGKGNQLLAPTEVRADGTKVFDLTMELADWEVEPGKVVEAWTFNGMVPAPMIDVEVGDLVEVRVQNDLPLATDVHWHGTLNDNANDGVAPFTQDLIEPGESFTYTISTERPSVAMYHPHAHGHALLPDGMFGVILIGDTPLPRGQTVGYTQVPDDVTVSQEIPMVLNDAGVIGYSLNGKSFPATEPISTTVGDWILVHYYNEGTQIHPMHLHRFDQIVIAKDGLPLAEPYAADTLNVAPGERYSVLFNIDQPGTWVWHCHILPHVERESGMFGMVTAVIATDPDTPTQ